MGEILLPEPQNLIVPGAPSITPAVYDQILRDDFATFIERAFRTVSGGGAFKDNWHIHAIAYELEELRHGRNDRLVITLPPRHLKSVITSVAFPAFLLGHDPAEKIVTASYSFDLAAKFTKDFRSVLASDWYRRIFPATRCDRASDRFIETTRHGYRLATSVDGPLTGRGGNIFVIDDPMKAQDAYSEKVRTSVNDWYRTTLLSRMDDPAKAKVILVMQRLHYEDLVGFVLEHSPGWRVLNLPAIAQEDLEIPISRHRTHTFTKGEILHPDRVGREFLEERRAAMGERDFAAQYLQMPLPPEGNIIKQAWLRRYNQLPQRHGAVRVVQSWDTGMKTGEANDYSVCTTWYIDYSQGWLQPKYYLADVLRARLDYPGLKHEVVRLMEQHRCPTVLVEDTGLGVGLCQELQRIGRHLIPIKPLNDKETRLHLVSARFENGQVFLPNSASWLATFEAELLTFPSAHHDDQVDSVSQALLWSQTQYNGPLQTHYGAHV